MIVTNTRGADSLWLWFNLMNKTHVLVKRRKTKNEEKNNPSLTRGFNTYLVQFTWLFTLWHIYRKCSGAFEYYGTYNALAYIFINIFKM
jgi:hypothetical protein